MDSAAMPKSTEADKVLASRADERLAHAYEQIASGKRRIFDLSELAARISADVVAAAARGASCRPAVAIER